MNNSKCPKCNTIKKVANSSYYACRNCKTSFYKSGVICYYIELENIKKYFVYIKSENNITRIFNMHIRNLFDMDGIHLHLTSKQIETLLLLV